MTGRANSVPSNRAEQCSITGQVRQCGARGVHTSAPSSISAWLKSDAEPSGINSLASFSMAILVLPFVISSLIRKYLDSTLMTFPSTAGSGKLYAMLRTAPAVYGPTPLSEEISSFCCGTIPPYLSCTSLTADWRFRARE